MPIANHCVSIARAFALMSFAAAPLRAQAPAGVLSGVVRVQGQDSTHLPDVAITLTPSHRAARTDSAGSFRFVSLPAGDYLLTARRLGYDALYKTFRVSGNLETSIRISMVPIAQRMATITVSGKKVTYPVRLSEPYQRLQRGVGHFITREQIDSLFPLDVASLLQRVPGVRVKANTIEFARCTELGSNNQKVQVWVDGQRWTNYSMGAELSIGAAMAIRDITPSSIQLMEIFSGPSTIPGEYVDDACAVILIWRK